MRESSKRKQIGQTNYFIRPSKAVLASSKARNGGWLGKSVSGSITSAGNPNGLWSG